MGWKEKKEKALRKAKELEKREKELEAIPSVKKQDEEFKSETEQLKKMLLGKKRKRR
jgi:hypothetical protein